MDGFLLGSMAQCWMDGCKRLWAHTFGHTLILVLKIRYAYWLLTKLPKIQIPSSSKVWMNTKAMETRPGSFGHIFNYHGKLLIVKATFRKQYRKFRLCKSIDLKDATKKVMWTSIVSSVLETLYLLRFSKAHLSSRGQLTLYKFLFLKSL